jgi:YidC/Oxa1 family membrane protein insertase
LDIAPVIADNRPRSVVVESDFVVAEFDNRGAELVSWKLKHYTDENGDPVELALPAVPAGRTRPFSLRIPGDPDLTARLDAALFRPSVDYLRLTADSGSLTFEYEDSSGLRARKTFRFQQLPDQPYVVAFDATVTTAAGVQPMTTAWGPGLGGVRAETSRLVFQQLPAAVLYGRPLEEGLAQDVDVYRASPADVPERPSYEGQFDFAGVDNHYFLAVALPGAQPSRVDYRPLSVAEVAHDLVEFEITLESGRGELPFYVGPKDFDLLQAVHPDLVRAIDFGFLSAIVVPLHRTLKWIHGFVGNYGWSIILLTVLINIVIFPLRHKSVVSMRKMQELQPEMKAIQARYANLKATDPGKQKMNQEVMELYRRHGANPASGCLPMLLTMPILIAFYRLLSMAVELRGAPFLGWISDLSVQDPFYVTPVIMGASMVYQQRLQPAGAASPEQQKMMMFMPVIFTVMFLWAPSGLVLYWMTSNILGIGQTVVTNRIAGPPRVKQVRPPAERQVKKVGGEAGPEPPPEGSTESQGRDRPGTKAARQGKGSRRSRGKGR